MSIPKAKPEKPLPKFGFVDNAERLNSRAAMVSFALLLPELAWMGPVGLGVCLNLLSWVWGSMSTLPVEAGARHK